MATLVYQPGRAAALAEKDCRFYVLHGADDVQKAEAVEGLRAALVDPGLADFDTDTVDLRSSDVNGLLASAGAAPVGSRKRLVIAPGAETLRRRERQADADALAAGAAAVGQASCVVLVVGAVDDDDRAGRAALSAKLDRALDPVSLFVHCRALSEPGLVQLLKAEAGVAGKRLDDDAALLLVRAAHGDRRALANELEKAICYAGAAARIDAQMAAAVASYDAEDVMFRLADAVGRRNASQALTLLHELLRADPKPQGVAARTLAVLSRQLKLLWQARELAALRVGPGKVRELPMEVAQQLPGEGSIVSMAWKAGDLFAMARGWTRPGLVAACDLVTECDLANKGGESGSSDVVTNLELLIVRLCAAA